MMTHYMFVMIDWLNPLVHVVGLSIAIWAFCRSRKRGYLVVATYFALAVFSLVAMPKINRIIGQRRGLDSLAQTQEKMNKAMHDAAQRVLKDEGSPPIAAKRATSLPLGPIVLVTGLWLVARKEKSTEPSVACDAETRAHEP